MKDINGEYLSICLEEEEWKAIEKRAKEAKLSIVEWTRLMMIVASGNTTLITGLLKSHRLQLVTIDDWKALEEISANWRDRWNEAQTQISSLEEKIKDLKKPRKEPVASKTTSAKKSSTKKKTPIKKIKNVFSKKKKATKKKKGNRR